MVAPKRDPDMNERATIPPFRAGFNDMRHKGLLFAIRSSRSASFQPPAISKWESQRGVTGPEAQF